MTVVDGWDFHVSADFLTARYDEWAFYRNQVSRIGDVKAVDLIAVARDASVAYLIEVKDYRTDPVTLDRRPRTKPSELPAELAAKVLHSLGGILAARTRAVVDAEQAVAETTCRALRLRVVLHLEQSAGPPPFTRVVDPVNVQIKLRKMLKGIDPRAIVVSHDSVVDLPWHVTEV